VYEYLLFQNESISELNGAVYRYEYYVVVDLLICILFHVDLASFAPSPMTLFDVENHELRRGLLNHWSIVEAQDEICVICSGYKYKRISIKKVVVRCRLRF
jgi:hypothetical protein